MATPVANNSSQMDGAPRVLRGRRVGFLRIPWRHKHGIEKEGKEIQEDCQEGSAQEEIRQEGQAGKEGREGQEEAGQENGEKAREEKGQGQEEEGRAAAREPGSFGPAALTLKARRPAVGFFHIPQNGTKIAPARCRESARIIPRRKDIPWQ